MRGEEGFQENAYWYYEAVEELKENANFDISDWGIYYYGIDSVITRSGNRSLKQYVENTLLQDGGDAEQAMHFFSEGNYRQMKMVFATTNTADSYEGKMLAGYCTTLGSGEDKALIFYVIDSQNYKDLWNVGYDEEGVYFYVLNSLTDQVFLAFGDAAGAEELRLEETERTTHGIRQKVLYQSGNSLLPPFLCCICDGGFAAEQYHGVLSEYAAAVRVSGAVSPGAVRGGSVYGIPSGAPAACGNGEL